jgi:hypothetical protein
MRIGIILTAGSARADVELAIRAEAAGFDGVYTIEFFNRNGYVPLGAIAQATVAGADRHGDRERVHAQPARARGGGDGPRRALERPARARARQRHAPDERGLVRRAVLGARRRACAS